MRTCKSHFIEDNKNNSHIKLENPSSDKYLFERIKYPLHNPSYWISLLIPVKCHFISQEAHKEFKIQLKFY